MGNFETARLAVRLGAVAANYRLCGELASPAAVAGVVKADAYGLGAVPVARALAQTGCDSFFVARLEEGIALRHALPLPRIFVLDGVQQKNASAFLAHNLVPVLNSLEQIEAWSAAAREQAQDLDCAIHVDTGMNRLGLGPEDVVTLAGEPRRLAHLRPALIMSHLACADDPQSPMNRLQRDRFCAAVAKLPQAPASLSSTGGVLLGRDYAFDMVRPGIGLYGGNPQSGRPNPFKVAAVLTGRILQLRRVDRGESVGYGATFPIERPSTLATVGLGYADGLMRAIGNRGAGAIAGIRAPIAGRLSMDLVTLDVTDVPAASCAVGSDVEFLGDTISLEEFANRAGTANYEILTSLGHRMTRHYDETPR